LKSGGFRGIYAGLGAAAVGSAPGAALFFSSYETAKSTIPTVSPTLPAPLVHMFAASFGEVMACLVRVPTEVVKQRYQAKLVDSSKSLTTNVVHLIKTEGVFGGLYRGFGITIMREIPFAWVQFPLYEWMKV
jgi:solute carrier family 25 S-adenosylmethionine transporter 26